MSRAKQKPQRTRASREKELPREMNLLRILGIGSSAVVSLAELQYGDGTTTLVAVKSPRNPATSRMIEREGLILDELKGCPEITQCIGKMADFVNGTLPICQVYLEYVPWGSLFSLLKSAGPLPEQQVRDYTKSILKGLAHIHMKEYVHCDIKPANILVCSSSQIKITDFGLAKPAGVGKDEDFPYEIRCTPQYMAPECVTRDMYEAPLDIWALGCTVAEMVTGQLALKFEDGCDLRRWMNAIGEGIVLPEIPEKLSEAGRDFLKMCFVREPMLRWTAEMLLKHPFLSDSANAAKTKELLWGFECC